MAKKAVVLLSGGLDSTTTLAVATHQGFRCYALSFDYGQKQKSELVAAKKIAQQFNVSDHKIIRLASFGGSALLDEKLAVPDYQIRDEIPITYVPARNIIFLSYALAYGEILAANNIFIGVNSLDYSGYPDCRPEFIAAFATMANLGTKQAVLGKKITIATPLIQLHKKDIIQLGVSLNVDYAQTVSCYRADKWGRACGGCDACTFRKQGFKQAGIADPTRYQRLS